MDFSAVQVQAAIVAGGVSLLVFAVGEVLKRTLRRKERKEDINRVFKRYADPLAAASVALLWRLQEVFDPTGKGFYLEGERHDTKYEHYKAMSTLYRLASVLGWIQALKRELVFLHGNRPRKVALVEAALARFAACLAEGGHVERTRLESLARLWEVDIASIGEQVIDQTGIRLDYLLKRKIHEHAVAAVAELSRDQAVELRNVVAHAFANGLGISPINPEILEETHARSLGYLAVREAWIYRDWQTAIGDVMLRPTPAGTPRTHEVIGYGDFEEICSSGEGVGCMWLRRLYGVIDDLEPLGDSSRDARIDQLQEVRAATGFIVRTLKVADRKNGSITKMSLLEAERVSNASRKSESSIAARKDRILNKA